MKINHASVNATKLRRGEDIPVSSRQRVFPLGYRSNDNNNKVVNQRIGRDDTIARFMEIGLTLIPPPLPCIFRVNVIPIPSNQICISFRPSRSIKIYSMVFTFHHCHGLRKEADISARLWTSPEHVRLGSNSFDALINPYLSVLASRIRLRPLYLQIDAPLENKCYIQNGLIPSSRCRHSSLFASPFFLSSLIFEELVLEYYGSR